MNYNYIVRRDSYDESFTPIKIEYYNPMDGRRVVSQTYIQRTALQTPREIRRINCDVVNSLPKIAIKRDEDQKCRVNNEVVLVNGCWDTSNKIPEIVAEMHVNTEDFLQSSSGPLNESRDFTSPSPRSSDSGIESDCTDGNLSWLLNYKIHELPPVPDSSTNDHVFHNTIPTTGPNNTKPVFPPRIVQIEVPLLTEEQNAEKDDGRSTGQSYRYSGPKKPPFTYTELIECALREKGELTVSGIYQWISENFPFYKQNDDRWKNSVRHNLSINPHFRKGGKAVQGAGHLWTIAQRDDKKAFQIKQRITQFIQNTYKDAKTREQEAFDRELQAATESILGEINNQTRNNPGENGSSNIEVEYINLGDGPNGLEDFLTPPVSKQEIVDECGLGSDFFITDINPNALGLNLNESEVPSEDKMYEDVFEYYQLKN